jgi:hypothetical protein
MGHFIFANVQGLVSKTGTEEKSGTWYTDTGLSKNCNRGI